MHVNQRGLSSGNWRARDYKVDGILEHDTVLKQGLAERGKMQEAVPAERAWSWGWELVMRLDVGDEEAGCLQASRSESWALRLVGSSVSPFTVSTLSVKMKTVQGHNCC